MESSATPPPQLRPLGVGEILDAAFKIYTSRFKTLVLCVLVPVVPITILAILLQASTNDTAFTDEDNPLGAQTDPATGTSTLDVDGAAIAGTLGSTVLQGLLGLLATAACVRAVSAAYLGDDVTWGESLRFAGRKLIPLIVATILVGLATFLGLFALLVGAVYVLVRLVVSTQALLVEDVGPSRALGRSWELVKGRWWAAFGTYVIGAILVGILAGVLQALLVVPIITGDTSQLVGAILTGFGQILSNTLALPLQAAILTILYFDLRVRKEGLDLALLAERMGGGGGGPAAVAHSSGLGDFRPPASPQPSSSQPPPQADQETYGGGFSAPRAPEEPGPDARA